MKEHKPLRLSNSLFDLDKYFACQLNKDGVTIRDRYPIPELTEYMRQEREKAWDDGQQAEKGYQDWASEAGGDTELMEDQEEPTNPYRKESKQ